MPSPRDGYERWRFERSLPTRRVGVAVAAVFWGSLALLMALTEVGAGPALLSVGVMGSLLSAQAVALRRRAERSVIVSLALTNACSGLLGVWLGVVHLPPSLHGSVVAGVVLATFFQLGASHDRPALTGAAVASFVVAEIAAVVHAYAHHEIEVVALVFETWLLVVAYGMALAMALVAESARRHAYEQERTIDAQRETIARERERREEILQRELSHQVAERSRELGAVLARSDVALDVRRLMPGELFAERYRIVSPLGAGGMGAVYEVERTTDRARLALKAVLGEVSGASAARFAREAEIGARVRHPNVVSIVDVGVAAGVPYLAMELLPGGSLESRRSRFGDVPWATAVLRQVAVGLTALHEAGVVHRDLKPANVLVGGAPDAPIAKISDFGISRFGWLEDAPADADAPTLAASARRAAPDLTGTGMQMGTPLYMAPEGARSARALEPSADVFALAILAHELLTGRSPFSVPAYLQALSGQPLAIPQIDDPRVPEELRALMTRSLSPDPSARPRARGWCDALGPREAEAPP